MPEPYADKLAAALSALNSARNKANVAAARRCLRQLHELEDQAADHEEWAGYVNALALAGFCLADWHICKHNYGRAYALICKSWRDLDERDKMRRLSKLTAARGTRARLALLGALADVKWRDPAGISIDAMLFCRTHCTLWCSLVDAYCERHKDAPIRGESRESILWGGIAVAALAFKYEPDCLPDVVRAWNLLHADPGGVGMLSGDLGHWRYPAYGDRNAFYWSFEICKEWLSGQMTLTTLNHLYAEYAVAATETVQPNGDVPFLAQVKLDKAWMRGELMRSYLTLDVRTA